MSAVEFAGECDEDRCPVRAQVRLAARYQPSRARCVLLAGHGGLCHWGGHSWHQHPETRAKEQA